MVNDIRFRVHTSYNDNRNEEDNTLSNEINNSNISLPPENNFGYLSLFILMSMTTSLSPVLSNSENRSSIIIERIFSEDESLFRDSKREIRINTQAFNTTNMKFDECSICTECFEYEDKVSVLECTHIFHSNCIKEWGHYNPSCPICKSTIPVEERELQSNDFYRMFNYDSINDLD